ncbi:hypothetical protein [Photobacterium leiognathi]|uniref:hypothetical protein n=1 Tax=Photobacterium leiognathi TaxID=553611 RepID=UPI0029824533|nr:hypothetical protein [Photobacterium leiognathi]
MLKTLVWVIALFVPLNTYAFSGTIKMHHIIFKQYELIDNTPTLFYTIKAKQQNEFLPEVNRKLFNALNNENDAKSIFNYNYGVLVIDPLIKISFEFGYYYKGSFVMNNVNGNIGQHRINLKKVIFNISKKQFITPFFIINHHGVITSKIIHHHNSL